eukprot:COSAG02_NODE_3742_length_6300_cov_8.889534_3_plen_633_part_00
MALDVYFQKPASGVGTYQPGFYRGIVDKVIKPPTAKTKAQTVEVDFPGDLTSAEIKVTEKSLLPPSTDRETVPAEPPKGADAVAIEVTEEEVAPDVVPKTPFGLTEEQKEAIDGLYFEDGHFVGAAKLWDLLGRKAEATPGAKPWFGVSNRQLRKYLASFEANQLFRIPKAPRDYAPFDLPQRPLAILQMDTLQFGDYAGKGKNKQGQVQVIVDPYTRYVWTAIRGGKSVSAAETSNGLQKMLNELREGPLAYSAENRRNVFNKDGTLTHVLKTRTDGGSEFKRTGASFEDVVHEVTLPASELREGLTSRLKNIRPFALKASRIESRYNLASAPNQAAFVERMNSNLLQHIRQAVQALHGTIKRSRAKKFIDEQGWVDLLRKVTAAINNERVSSTGLTPNEAMKYYLNPPEEAPKTLTPAQQAKLEKRTEDEKRRAEAKDIAEQSRKLQVGQAVRLVNMATQKASLRGKKKFEPRWSETVYRIRQRNRRGGESSNMTYVYKLEQMTGEELSGTFRREQLLVVPEMETEYLADRNQKGLSEKLSKANTIPRLKKVDGKWKSIVDGSSWAEKQVAKLSDEEVGEMSRTKLMWRLVSYLRQGNSKEQAMKRLKDSIETAPDPSAPLAIVTYDKES